mgnify:CR=1 FL=1
MSAIKDQEVTKNYAIYNGDCMDVLQSIPDESVDLSIYSPPFAGLYNYSSSERDFSNCENKEQFLDQYDYLIAQMARVTKPGRITAVHCTDVFDNACRLWDFPHEIIRIHEKYGLLTKKGDNAVPVTHSCGFKRYAGDTPILPNILQAWNNANDSKLTAEELWDTLNKMFYDHEDPKSNKLSHYIWQRYASSVRDDIRIDNVLPFRDAREEDDEKHVHPLQLDVIDRLVDLYSNVGETVLTPFMGVGSEVYSPVSLGRKAIGIELKDSYFKQAKINLSLAESRFTDEVFEPMDLFA